MLQSFRILASAVNIYSFLCFIRITLTWFPKANYSSVGRILSSICDPYLNLFKKFRFLIIRGLDFSPAAALCVLFALATILTSLSAGHPLSVGYFLAILVSLIWSIISSVFKFLIALLIIRLIFYMIMHFISKRKGYQSYSPIWDQIDHFISPYIYKVSGIFIKRFIPFTTALIITIIISIIAVKLADFAIAFICTMINSLPF